MRPADRDPSFRWVFGILLAALACYPVTEPGPNPESQTPSQPVPPPRVGAVVYGTIQSASNLPLLWASAGVEVFDPTCTNSIPGIRGIGYAPGYKEGLTYQARMVADRTAFDACVQVEVTYAVADVPGIHATVLTIPVMFTALGATPAAVGQHLDVWLP